MGLWEKNQSELHAHPEEQIAQTKQMSSRNASSMERLTKPPLSSNPRLLNFATEERMELPRFIAMYSLMALWFVALPYMIPAHVSDDL
jgi:hypothetical protein